MTSLEAAPLAPSTITFPEIPNKLNTEGPFALAATASSGLAVSYQVASAGGVATVAGATVTLGGATGSVTIQATQVGDSSFAAATPVYRTFTVRNTSGFTKLAGGPFATHAAGIRADGTLWTWGTNIFSQLGDGTTIQRDRPVQVGSATNWQSVVVGANHTLALQSDGALWAWGGNFQGQLGDGSVITRTTPVQIAGAWRAVSAGSAHTAAIKSDGTLWTWGSNSSSQLGDGGTTQRPSPFQVGTDTTWQSVAAGGSSTMAIKSNGTLWAWGNNDYGKLGLGDGTPRSTPVQVGTATNWQSVTGGNLFTMGLRTDGTLWSWGWGGVGALGSGNTGTRAIPGQVPGAWQSIEVGSYHSVGIKSDGTLWAWGYNIEAEVGDGSQAQRLSPVRIGTAANWTSAVGGSRHTLALASDGTVSGWGNGSSGQLSGISRPVHQNAALGGVTVISSAAGNNFSAVVKSDGTLWTWGGIVGGELPLSTNSATATPIQVGVAANWLSVEAGSVHAAVLKTDNTLWTWGSNGSGQLGLGDTTLRTAPVQIAGAWRMISAGGSHNAAIKSDGTLWTWGGNFNGQLGLGDTTQRSSPVQVGVETTWQSVGTGGNMTFAIKNDGTLWAWGANGAGQLGDNSITQRLSPVKVGTATNWTSVAGGSSHTVAKRSDGTFWVWGRNSESQLGDGTVAQRNSPMQVAGSWLAVTPGGNHTVGIKSDGTLWAWGFNGTGQLGDGTTTTRSTPQQLGTTRGWSVVESGCNASHTLALHHGQLWAFGSNQSGQVLGGDIGRCVPRPVAALRAEQSVTIPNFYAAPNVPVTLPATASSGLPVSYSVSGNATLSGNVLTYTGTGPATVDAWQVGDDKAWQPAAVQSVEIVPEIAVAQPIGTDLADGGSRGFGTVVVGANASLTFTITNYGTANLNGLTITTDGAAAADFTVTTAPTAPVAGLGGSTTFTVRFAPSAAGARNAVLHIASDDADESPFDISVAGTGIIHGTLAIGVPVIEVYENAGVVQVPLVRTVGSDGAVSVRFSAVKGTAGSPGDFIAITNQLVNFAEGETSKMVPVTIVTDSVITEINETFTVRIATPTGGAILGAQSSATVVISEVDVTVPTVSIAKPAANAKVPEGVVVATGQANDDKGLQKVEVSLNGGAFVETGLVLTNPQTRLFGTWTATITPVVGSNTLAVRSTDLRGHVSNPVTRTFKYVNLRPLALTISPLAGGTVTVTPALVGGKAEIGVSYTLKATAKTGFLWNRWTAPGVSGAAATSTSLTVVMSEGLAITAGFVGNAYTAGTYTGLAEATGATAPARRNFGLFSGVVTAMGGLTGKVTFEGTAVSFTATFDKISGNATGTSGGLSYDLTLDLSGATEKITGTITQTATGEVSAVDADHATFSATNKVPNALLKPGSPASNGVYTVAFPSLPTQAGLTSSDYPNGDGFGTITVTPAGAVSITGTLADGSAITASAPLSLAYEWPLAAFVKSSATVAGLSFGGMVQFDTTAADSDLSATDLKWFCPAAATGVYPAGWPDGILVNAVGAHYNGTLSVETGLGLAAPSPSNGQLVFAGGGLSEDITKTSFAITGNVVSKTPDPTKLDASYTLVVVATTGAFNGTFTPDWAGASKTKPAFKGIMIQKAGSKGGYGYFLNNGSGAANQKAGGVSLTAP